MIGGPGAGKTIFASQFLYNGITEYNENGVFMSLDEGKNHFFAEMAKFGWDFKKAEQEGKFGFLDATRLSRVAMLEEKKMQAISSSLRGKELQVDLLVDDMQAS